MRVYLAICQPRSTSIVYSLFSFSLVKRRTFSHSNTLNQQTDRAGTNRYSIPIAIASSSEVCWSGVGWTVTLYFSGGARRGREGERTGCVKWKTPANGGNKLFAKYFCPWSTFGLRQDNRVIVGLDKPFKEHGK